MAQRLVEGRDYYWDAGKMVLTARFLSERGYCCANGCRHCPYGDSGRGEPLPECERTVDRRERDEA